MGVCGLFRGHSQLETEASLVTKQAKYEKDFTADNANFNEPKIILNPYKNSPLTALVIFKTSEEVAPKVEVKSKDDSTSIIHTFSASTEHFLPIYGLYADYDNTVIMSYEINGQQNTSTLSIKTEPLPENITNTELAQSNEELNNSLHFTTIDSTPIAYDNSGNIRWYFTQKTIWNNDRLKNGHFLIGTEHDTKAQNTTTGLYEIDLLGKIYKEYTLPGGYHHDYFEMPNGNLLVASNDFKTDTVEDFIAEINRESGEVVKSYSLKNILPSENNPNWLQNDSIWYNEDTNNIILSSLRKDAIIAMSYATGELKWIYGDKSTWPESYHKYFVDSINENYETNTAIKTFEIYYEGEGNIKLGKAERIGKILESTTNSIEHNLITSSKAPDNEYKSHNIKLEAEEDRLSVSGNLNEKYEIILTKGFEIRHYEFDTPKANINSEGLSGLYNIYIKLDNTTYDTGKSIKF